MNKDEMNIVNKINNKKQPNVSVFNKNIISDTHDAIVRTIRRENMNPPNKPTQAQSKLSSKAEVVKSADVKVRQAISDLVVALCELGDNEIAVKLISDHIFLLRDVFDNFDAEMKK